MHKNKKRLAKEERGQWRKQIILSLGVAIVGITGILLVQAWGRSLPIMQPHYARPGEFDMSNGLWVLIIYGILLLASVVGGYFVQRRIEENK